MGQKQGILSDFCRKMTLKELEAKIQKILMQSTDVQQINFG